MSWRSVALGGLAIVLVYYAVPVNVDSAADAAVRFLISALGVAAVMLVMVRAVTRLRTGAAVRSNEALVLLLVLLVVAFAFAIYILDRSRPEEFVGLGTRTDALYFTLTTMTTVGYGDVHADGQLARALMCCLLVFNVLVVAAFVRALAARANPHGG